MIVTVNSRIDKISANEKFALGDSKNIRSTQYSMSHRNMDMRIAKRVHRFPVNRPHKSATPATTHPIPVMDKYNGPRWAPNSFNTSHQRKAPSSRTTPHADKLNTSHMSRVTPKGRFRGMDLTFYNDNRFRLAMERIVIQIKELCSA